MARIRFEVPDKDRMDAKVAQVPILPAGTFRINFPESIGSTESAKWSDVVRIHWTEQSKGRWSAEGAVENELSFNIQVIPCQDHVDFYQTLTNETSEPWRQTLAFNCLNAGPSPQIRDHDCTRHWVRTQGNFWRLTELPRVLGPRPTIQLYSVENQPPGRDIPFVKNFRATPDAIVVEGWLAIQSRDGRKLVAVVSKPALFTFQNMEYSCIHSSAAFGSLTPGKTGKAFTRLYFVESSLEDWYKRMTQEIEDIEV